jgi:hypothetical protein
MKPRTTCPDCDAPLVPIELRDHSYGGVISPPEYQVPPAQDSRSQGFWQQFLTIPPGSAGKIHGRMCSDCGRVLFYADPQDG